MDSQLQTLGERAARLVEIARKLADENRALRSQLDSALAARENLERRVVEARARVESALARLPLIEDSES